MAQEKKRRVGTCPVCRRETQQLLEWQYRHWEKVSTDASEEDQFNRRSYYLGRCEDCTEFILYINDPPHDDICDNFEGSQPEADTVVIWPKLSVSSEAVPERVREIYEEAVAVRSRSLASFATTIRRGLEAICDDRRIGKAPLAKRLQALAFSSEVAPRLAEIADVLRYVGNVGAHNDRDVTKMESEVIDKCFNLIVDYFYDVPDQIRQLKQKMATVAEREFGDTSGEIVSKSDLGKIQ